MLPDECLGFFPRLLSINRMMKILVSVIITTMKAAATSPPTPAADTIYYMHKLIKTMNQLPSK